MDLGLRAVISRRVEEMKGLRSVSGADVLAFW